MPESAPLSKNQVNKAGRKLVDFRRSGRGAEDLDEDELNDLVDALEIVQAWRATFSTPLTKVRMGLGSFIKTTGVDAALGQRHKRVRRIIAKLARPGPTMALARMQDVGGCRVVLPTLEDLRGFEEHLRGVWDDQIRYERDYVTESAESGYRAQHVVVLRDDRLIEIQLRTEKQHEWADYVEGLGRRIGFELKAGEGPDEVLRLLRIVADLMACEELGEEPPSELLAQYDDARRAARRFLQ